MNEGVTNSVTSIASAPPKLIPSVERSAFQVFYRRIQATWSPFEHKLHSNHLSHRGSYSIERMQAFDDYWCNTSILRVSTVCLALSFPAFLVSLLIKFIPVQDPLDGWKANYGVWVRFFVATRSSALDFLYK